jgi:hydrogenase-4 component F
MRVEEANLQVEDRFARDAEKEVAGLDNPRVDRADRDLKNTFALDGTEFVALALEWGELGVECKIFAQGIDFRPIAMRLAFIMIVLGYGTKAGLAPMHTWKPDAYEEAPVPTAAMLGAAFVNCAIYGIIRYHTLATKCLGHAFPENLLVGFGVGSILLAAPFVLVQRNFRRILAYSSIDHAGIMVAAVGFGGKLGLLGALLHMVYHAITKPMMFFCAGNIQQHYKTPYFRKVTGVIQTLPLTGALFLIATFAVTGMPPFSLFQSEFTALSGALAAGRNWAAGLFVLGIVTIFAGFLVHMSKLNLGTPREEVASGKICPWKTAAITLVAAVVIGIACWVPRSGLELISQAVALIGG